MCETVVCLTQKPLVMCFVLRMLDFMTQYIPFIFIISKILFKAADSKDQSMDHRQRSRAALL